MGSSGSGKTKLLIRYLLDGTLDYERLVLCSPSLKQPEYQVLIKGLNAGLSRAQVAKLFAVQRSVSDVDKALAYVKSIKKPKEDVVTAFADPADLPDPQTLTPKTLVCVDDCTILD